MRFSTWLLREPSAVLCEDPNQLAWGGLTCQHSHFSFQWLGKHGRATKLAFKQGAEEPRGTWGLLRAEALVGRASPCLQPGPPLTDIVGASGRCAEPWGGGKGLIICISAGLQSTSSGEEVLLCWHPLEIKGGWWKRAGLRQPNLHACFITFASIDVKGGKKNKKTLTSADSLLGQCTALPHL